MYPILLPETGQSKPPVNLKLLLIAPPHLLVLLVCVVRFFFHFKQEACIPHSILHNRGKLIYLPVWNKETVFPVSNHIFGKAIRRCYNRN